MEQRSGFVNIVGNPNTGKSTLMNRLIGHNLSIITPKAQTTRHRILGILNGDGYQIVFSDTPGLVKPRYKLQHSMLKASASALDDADILLIVTTPEDDTIHLDTLFPRIAESEAHKIIVINKIDISSQPAIEQMVDRWSERIPGGITVPVSARLGFNLDQLLKVITGLLPLGEPFFPEGEISDRYERFFASEIIREKVLLNYRQEVPYSTEVEISSFTEESSIIRISAIIHTERESQKGIVIGHRGSGLKKTGTMARESLEEFLGKKVFLELRVKVSPNWREKVSMLKRFGYH